MVGIKSITELLKMNLDIPPYQRPYKWTIQNITDLLNDIKNSIESYDKYKSEFKYRIGSIIIHNNQNGKSDVVDGQQRVISLALLKLCIDPGFTCPLLEKDFSDKVTQRNIHNNYVFIREWFSLNEEEKRRFNMAFNEILQVVVIVVETPEEAFQLFDSQNTRGKELDPHDLLKAYHLREMKNHPYEMEHAVTKWESKDTSQIKNLFDLYMFPIWNWSRGIKTRPFTAKEIDTYKGVEEESDYSYARRTSKAMPYFQITEPFVAGNDFFEMVDHYLLLLADIKKEIHNNNEHLIRMAEILEDTEYNHSTGFRYTKNLFYCALLCYYDKFHNFDELAVRKLFSWALMLRIDMTNLGFDSINKYSIGDGSNSSYTNTIPMFSKISFARKHTEISGLQIRIKRPNDEPANKNWRRLYTELKHINGITEEVNG